ncbi:helix-turn-helix domain-containing protein [Paenibacillus chitinolyticus]|uniref:helix-turn-helix domain-containing protein n=1 Tax=Paenibacillus chitinolyticus TaxID=79263 RepID=UPI003D0326DD
MDELILIGVAIRDLRKSKGLSQGKLADLVDTQASYISAVERGEKNVTVETLTKIAAALGENLFEMLNPNKEEIESIKQIDELLNGKTDEKRKRLLEIFEMIARLEQ